MTSSLFTSSLSSLWSFLCAVSLVCVLLFEVCASCGSHVSDKVKRAFQRLDEQHKDTFRRHMLLFLYVQLKAEIQESVYFGSEP